MTLQETFRPVLPRQESAVRYNNLTELRAIFALFVVIAHTVQLANIDGLYFLRIVFSSDTAVQAFFILSGFLTVDSCYRSTGGVWLFYERRLARIYAAYAVSIVFFCALGVAQAFLAERNVSWSDLTRYLSFNLLLANFLQPSIGGVFTGNSIAAINGALWTIKVEASFYLLVPALVFFGRKISFVVVAIGMITAGLLWGPALSYLRTLGFDQLPASLQHQLPGQFLYFGFGVLLFWLSRNPDKLAIPTAIVVLAAFGALALGEGRHAIQIIVLCVLIYGAIQFPQVVWPAKDIDLSYGIYLSHFPIIQLLVNWRSWGTLDGMLLLMLVLALSGSYAFASWFLIEKPAMAFAKRRSQV